MDNRAKAKKDTKQVKEIFEEVIVTIDNSKGKILDIVDDARKAYEKLKNDLENVNTDMDVTIQKVDSLEMKNKIARNALANVSKNFGGSSEADIKNAYETATEMRVQLIQARADEKSIHERRLTIEVAIKEAIRNIQNAEQIANQVTIAASYLKGEILSAIEDADLGSSMMVGVKILEAQENERQRISRDIHDGPAQHVANIVMKADLCEKIAKKDIEKGIEQLRELKKSARGALKEVRDIIYNLRPMSLDDLGLNKTVEMNGKSIFEGTDIKIKYSLAKMNENVEKIIQVAIFRLVQETLNNIKKHSKATNVFIKTEYGTKYLRVTIGDNGIGFDYYASLEKAKVEKKSYGLVGINERVAQLKGELIVESNNNIGTIFNIKLPINREVILDE